jgi:alkylated DNA repair dioxygenase AlkB
VRRSVSSKTLGDSASWPRFTRQVTGKDTQRHVGQSDHLGGRTSGLCLYRDGAGSVAWHEDRTGRSRTKDTMVAIVSLGAPRRFLLRPRGGGPLRHFELGRGDLFVMGGSCQRTREHTAYPNSRMHADPDQRAVSSFGSAMRDEPLS